MAVCPLIRSVIQSLFGDDGGSVGAPAPPATNVVTHLGVDVTELGVLVTHA